LYYWRGDNYQRDLDFGVGYHLNQKNPLLHQIEIGDSLWAFTRRKDGTYVLAAELVTKAKTKNPAEYRYGRYRLWGDLEQSRYFDTQTQTEISALIRGLSIQVSAARIGQSFQGNAAVRRITREDDSLLRRYAASLSLEPRARLIPEEKLEAVLYLGRPELVEELLVAEMPGASAARQTYLTTETTHRNRRFVEELREIYSGQCQICLWSPRNIYETDLCESHHVRWLSRGGEDKRENLVLLCPNHHRAIHRVDAPFDWEDRSFVFSNLKEPLRLEKHEIHAY
jgi:hypothetical protein